MSNETPMPAPDDRITRGLRARYAAPADERFWDSLEAEILARTVGGETGAWWAIPPRWSGAGLLAAGLALAAAGLALASTRHAEARRAFEDAMATPVAVQAERAAFATGASGREETLYYLISH